MWRDPSSLGLFLFLRGGTVFRYYIGGPMNDIQKNQINEMRQLGYSYKRIATTLSLKEGTVKSYCIRAVKRGDLILPNTNQNQYCRQCGQPLVQKEKRKKKLFCSSTCRQKWWNTHQYLVNRSSKATYHFTCPTCGKSFSSYGNPNRKYCSHDCYIKARYYKDSSHE